MTTARPLAALLLAVAAPLLAAQEPKKAPQPDPKATQPTPAATDDNNPYKAAKVGDFAIYKMKVSVGMIAVEGTTKQQVIAKSDKDATVKVTATASGMEAPAQEQKVDITKPYDPTKIATEQLPPGTEATVEKGKDGKEKIKIGTKDFDCTWVSYKVKAKAMGQEVDADVKVWTAKEVPMGMVKLEMTAVVAKMDMKMSLELAEAGNQPLK